MKIAYLIGSFPALSETFILNQITGMIDRGHEIQIFSLHRPIEKIIHPDVEKYGLLEKTTYLPQGANNRWIRRIQGALLLPWFCWHNPRLLNYFLSWHLSKGFLDIAICAMARYYRNPGTFDVTHAQFGHLGAKLSRLKIAGIIRGPLVTSFRGGDTSIVLRQNPDRYVELYHVGDLFLPVCEFLSNLHLRHGCDRSKIEVLHSGVDTEKHTYSERLYQRNGITRIAWVGRHVEKKGVRYLLEVVRLLEQSGVRVALELIGDGPLRGEMEGWVTDHGLGHAVVFRGWQTKDEVIDILGTCHIFVCPSVVAADGNTEGIPNALKEAMAQGIPVVATDTGGVRELIEDGVTGLLVPQKDSKALEEKITYLIDNPHLQAKLAPAARERIEQEFDIEKLNERLARLYEKLISDVRSKDTCS